MHFPLYQISTKPISENEYKSEYDYESDDFVMANVDYIVDYSIVGRKNRRAEDIEFLMKCLPKDCFTLEGNVLTMVKKPTEFGEKKIARIKELADILDIDKLSDPNNTVMFALEREVGGTRFYSEMVDFDNDFCSLDNWVLQTLFYEEGTKFYIGGIVGFHN